MIFYSRPMSNQQSALQKQAIAAFIQFKEEHLAQLKAERGDWQEMSSRDVDNWMFEKLISRSSPEQQAVFAAILNQEEE